MENLYNDELLPNNFEQIAKAYSKSLKDKGFVFIRLEEEEFQLLLNETFVIIAKMKACLMRLQMQFDSKELHIKLCESWNLIEEKFGTKKMHSFECIETENMSFLSLVSLENLLIIKLMLLGIKSGEIELCNGIITSIAGSLAESFSCEGFKVSNDEIF